MRLAIEIVGITTNHAALKCAVYGDEDLDTGTEEGVFPGRVVVGVFVEEEEQAAGWVCIAEVDSWLVVGVSAGENWVVAGV